MTFIDVPEPDPRCGDERTVRALHEAAHAVVAVLLGLDFESLTLPAPKDMRVGLAFRQYTPDPDEPLVAEQVQRQMTMRYAAQVLEERLCGEVHFAGQNVFDAQNESEAVTTDPQDAHAVRQLCLAWARVLVDLAWEQIERVGAQLLEREKLDWGELTELVLGEFER